MSYPNDKAQAPIQRHSLFGIIPISFVYFFQSFLCILAGLEEGAPWVNGLLFISGIFFIFVGFGLLRQSAIFRRAAVVFSMAACLTSFITGLVLLILTFMKHAGSSHFSLEHCMQFITGFTTYYVLCVIYLTRPKVKAAFC